MKPLTEQQCRFVQEFLKDGNGTQAAIRAGVSEGSAPTTASRWLKLQSVQDAIKPAVKQATDEIGVQASTILRELMHIATFDPKDLLEDDGTPKPLSTMSENVRRAIGSIEVEVLRRKVDTDDGVTVERSIAHVAKIRMLDKLRALELLGKHLKLFTDRVQIDANVIVEVVDPYSEN